MVRQAHHQSFACRRIDFKLKIGYYYISMTIEWYGQSCFKISLSGAQPTTILTEPFSKETGLNPPRFKPDILILSREVEKEMAQEAQKEGMVLVKDPGEYEIKGVEINGFAVPNGENALITVYKLEIEGIKICYLNGLKKAALPDDVIEAMSDADILLIPVGGKETIGPEEAVELINDMEPKIVIPMNYKIPGLKANIETVDKFLKAMGHDKVEPAERLTVKKKDFQEMKEKMEIKILKV